MKTKNLRHLFALSVALVFAACGGGGGGSGGSGSPSTPASSPSGSAMSTGVITGFGSVIVNGVHFDDSDAQIDIADPDDQVELRVGMVVEVDGTMNDDGTGKAATVRFENLVRGPVESIDIPGNKLVVLGQPITVNDRTVFDDVAGLSALRLGDIVNVSGFIGPTGTILATRIEKKPAPFMGTLKVQGTIVKGSLDRGAKTFQINKLTVNFGGAQPKDLDSTLEEGMFVEVKSHTLPIPLGGVLFAESVRVKPNLTAGEGVRVEVEGLVTQCNADGTFVVRGITIDARSVGLTCTADLVGKHVEVKGVIVNGILVVSTSTVSTPMARIEHEGNIKIEARAQAIDPTGSTLTVLGKKVAVTPFTLFRDEGKHDHFFSLTAIQPGDFLIIRAFVDSAGNIVARMVERDNTQSQVFLQGPVDSENAAATSLTIVGIKVQGDPSATIFIDGQGNQVSAAEWFAATPLNTLVGATGVEGADGKSVDVTHGQMEVQHEAQGQEE